MDQMEDIAINIKTEVGLENVDFPEIVIVKKEQEFEIPEVKLHSSDYSQVNISLKEEEHNEDMFGKFKYVKTENQYENMEKTVKNEEVELSETSLEINDYNNFTSKKEMNDEYKFGKCKHIKTEKEYEAYGDNFNLDHDVDKKMDISAIKLLSTEYNDDKIVFDSKSKISTKLRKNNSENNLDQSTEYQVSNLSDSTPCRIHRCSLCSYKTKSISCLSIHLKSIHNKRKKNICQFCDILFAKKCTLDNHMLKKHKQEIKSNMNDFITSTIHKCKMCSYVTTAINELKRHINSLHIAPKTNANCQFCDELFTSRRSLDDHLLKQHEPQLKGDFKSFITSAIFKCDSCSYKTIQKFDLMHHNISFHNKEKTTMNCQFCNKVFMSKKSLNDHVLKKHREEIKNIKGFITSKIHSCGNCSYQTVSKSHFDIHLSTKHNKHRTKMKCKFCAKLFLSKTSLDYHMFKQHKQEIKGDLKSVITSKVYKCHSCPYGSLRKCDLIRHNNSIHKEQIFCQFCDISFMSKQLLGDHFLKQHRDETKSNMTSVITTKINCSMCPYQTEVRYNFIRHFNSIHNEHTSEIKCQFCDRLYLSKKALKGHLNKQHKNEIKTI